MIDNLQIWDSLRKAYPQFASHTSKGTKELFTAKGFEALQVNDAQAINEFFNLSMRVFLQTVNVSRAKDPLEAKGFGEHYNQPNGGIIQRMAVNSIKPISPAYKNLTNGSTIDPFVVRKPEAGERFFKQNFDYQSLITIPDEFAMKQIFISEFGMSEFMGGIMEGLKNGYTTQVYLNKIEAINAGINSMTRTLKPTQKVTVELGDTPTTDQLVDFILAVNDIVSAMDIAPQTSGFNAMGFDSTQDISRLKLLIRPGYLNLIKTHVLPNAYNQEQLNLPVDVIEVENFGGLTPFTDPDLVAPALPIYNTVGELTGYGLQPTDTVPLFTDDQVFWKDPNEDVVAILVDKGYVFTSQQNPYSVEPIRNPRGLYTNYWASSPNNTIACDPLYNIVVFKKVDDITEPQMP
jgi:hypothetical protein